MDRNIEKWKNELARDRDYKYYKWTRTRFELSNGTAFYVMHNLETQGPVNSIDAAFQSWLARTDTYTCLSLCKYINSKREKGMSNHYAFPFEENFSLQ